MICDVVQHVYFLQYGAYYSVCVYAYTWIKLSSIVIIVSDIHKTNQPTA